jgi:hypothetical protein
MHIEEGIAILVITIIVTLVVGAGLGKFSCRTRAIEAGVGTYICNPVTGSSTFVWGCSKCRPEILTPKK